MCRSSEIVAIAALERSDQFAVGISVSIVLFELGTIWPIRYGLFTFCPPIGVISSRAFSNRCSLDAPLWNIEIQLRHDLFRQPLHRFHDQLVVQSPERHVAQQVIDLAFIAQPA
jgi:hypothetical protein